jgi:hypothetical protein
MSTARRGFLGFVVGAAVAWLVAPIAALGLFLGAFWAGGGLRRLGVSDGWSFVLAVTYAALAAGFVTLAVAKRRSRSVRV